MAATENNLTFHRRLSKTGPEELIDVQEMRNWEGKTLMDTEEKMMTEKANESMVQKRAQQTIKWPMLFNFLFMHIAVIFALTQLPYMKWQSLLWYLFTLHLGGFGITAGAHRLWAHHSYTASLPLRIFLMIGYSAAGMNSLYAWVRDHRTHHKYTDTDLDPHNATRGFFYSHVGWLMVYRHPDSHRVLRETNMEDFLADPVAVFQTKYHQPLVLLFCFILPIVAPVLCWNETWLSAIAIAHIRWVSVLNFTFLVNSAAHLFGSKPFNKKIMPSNNRFVSLVAGGEGWHNYHHMFPWDHRTSEHHFLNLTLLFIRSCKSLGLASDLKTAPPDLIKNVMLKYGDGSHPDWVAVGPEIPIQAIDDPALLETLLAPKFNKHQ